MSEDRELDAQVAVTIMGGRWIRYWDASYEDPDTFDHKVHAFVIVDPDDLTYYLTYSRYNKTGAERVGE